MYKNALISSVSAKTGIAWTNVEAVIDAFTEVTAEAMSNGESVILFGFGIFEPKSRSPRIGRNPHTGEPVEIPARVMPSFKPAPGLKERVSGTVSNPATKSPRTSPAK